MALQGLQARLAAINDLAEQLLDQPAEHSDVVHRLGEIAVRLPCPGAPPRATRSALLRLRC